MRRWTVRAHLAGLVALAAGAPLAIAFSDRPLAAEALVPFVVGLAALALAIAFVVALRRKPR